MEREFHRWIKSLETPSPLVRLGIGDDAAILQGESEGVTIPGILVTTDAIAEGTHFDSSKASLSLIGRKAIAISLSDVAAMGAKPIGAVMTLMLPSHFRLGQVQELFLGAKKIADQFQTPIIGGDTNCWEGGLTISVTILALDLCSLANKPPWLLSGARVDHLVVVSGSFGGSLLGRHLNFEPRIALARYLVENYQVHAATDVSDSLSLDLSLMCSASQSAHLMQSQIKEELGVELDWESIPVHPDANRLSQTSKQSALHHALTDGEDFELILAVDPEEFARMENDVLLKQGAMKLTAIGRFVARPGFWLLGPACREAFEPRGYTH
jgi:thiamine-monophosphate kinase